MARDSYVNYMEGIAKQVAKEMADEFLRIEKALMPDGRPVFGEKVSDVARCANYLLREGNPQAQYEYVSGLVASASAKLAEYSVDPAAAHVWDAAFNFAVIESAELREKMFRDPVLYAEAYAEAQRIMQEQMMTAPTPPMFG